MKLLLIGFATSYKSSVARQLSQKLNVPLFDVDKLAESKAGMSISQMFALHGESYFRDIESQALRELATKAHCIISCGGGSVLSQDFPALVQNATVVWLKVDGATAHSRLNGHTRPLFDKLTVEQLSEKINARNPYYAKYATVQVDTTDKSSKQVFAQLCDILGIK